MECAVTAYDVYYKKIMLRSIYTLVNSTDEKGQTWNAINVESMDYMPYNAWKSLIMIKVIVEERDIKR